MTTIYPFVINWSSPFEIAYEFKTDVIISRNGTEQRSALRSFPRISLTFESIPEPNLDPALGGNLTYQTAWWQKYGRDELLVPEYSRTVSVVVFADTGATEIEIDKATPLWINPGEIISIRQGRKVYQNVVVSVAARTITLDQPLTAPVRVGASVSPVHVCRSAPNATGVSLTARIGTNKASFRANPGMSPVFTTFPVADTFDGLELWLKKPNYSSGIDYTWENDIETLDFDIGRVSHAVPLLLNGTVTKVDYLGKTSEEVDEIVSLFYRSKGQRGVFYAPSWTDDLSRFNPRDSGDHFLLFEGLDVLDLYDTSLTHKAVIVFYVDGTYQANRLNGIADISGRSRMNFVDNWSQEISAENVKIICWLNRYRLASDNLTVSWLTNQKADVTYTLRMVRDDQ